ncbi:hypothetical protein EGW08_003262 [Elysia chlorotica]|uniref:SAM domain-containing protein n=1 Tax=Elysia chlorotica TaxID=188477 RepID=A0A3S1ADC3_ELYCH|nr:hypothetical protein EGW08_003262 [Elysia chlorotica]
MNRISWKDKVTNKEVLDKVGMQKPELLQLIQRRKLAYYGHIRRHCSIQKRVVEGKVEGKRGRGRKRQSWLANIQETSQLRLSGIKLMHSISENDTTEGQSGKGPAKFSSSLSSPLPSPFLRQTGLPGVVSNSSSSVKSEPPLVLGSNPLEWTVAQVAEFLETSDCGDGDLVNRLKTEEIDGQALLLLTLPNVQEYLGIKLGPAIKLCHLIERVKVAFFQQFAT